MKLKTATRTRDGILVAACNDQIVFGERVHPDKQGNHSNLAHPDPPLHQQSGIEGSLILSTTPTPFSPMVRGFGYFLP
jgi:hypothetical protein